MLTRRSPQRSLRASSSSSSSSLRHTSRLSSRLALPAVPVHARFQSASSVPAKEHQHHQNDNDNHNHNHNHNRRRRGEETLEPEPAINAPLSTLPAPLELPQKTPGEATISYLFKTGKAYLDFYKTGVKNVYHNFVASRPIQNRIDEKGSIANLVEANQINRSEFQLIMRTRHDSRRIPIFGLAFIVLGEFSPFILPFISGIVPFNCRIPRQIHGDRVKLEARRAESFKAMLSTTTTNTRARAGGDLATLVREKRTVKDLTSREVLHCSTVLGLHSAKWPAALYPFLPPTIWLRFKLRRWIAYLDLDDKLLSRGGGPNMLNGGEELKMAATDRGFDTLQKTEARVREELKLWLKAKETAGGSTLALWLTKPAEWKISQISHTPTSKDDRLYPVGYEKFSK